MNETEIYKIVLNNGFMALFVVWVLFKGEPRYREMIERIETAHKSTIDKLTEDHKKVVEAVCKVHEAVISNLHRECREERKEILMAIQRENELNRVSRHDLSNSLQQSINQIYSNRIKDLREKSNKHDSDKPIT